MAVELRGKSYPGRGIVVAFDATRCRHFAECVRGLPEVFDAGRRPWIQPDNAEPDLVAEVVRRCPSGALHYEYADGTPEPPDAPATATALPGGPLLLRGDLRVRLPDGSDFAETRMAACTCGRSANLPFCDAACETLHAGNTTQRIAETDGP